MSDETTGSGPPPSLRSLDRLVDTWAVSGSGISGTVRYEWMDGGGFLVQHVDLRADEGDTRGLEYIGFDKESNSLRSHFFGSGGEILEYTYDLTGDTLTIWFGDSTSPAKFVGVFNADDSTNTGAWEWPGGGYESTMARIS